MRKFLNDIKHKKILILGLGREGLSTYKVLRKAFPDKKLAIADGNPDVRSLLQDDTNIEYRLGEDYLLSIRDFDLVFKTPGISLKDFACSEREKITSQTDVFMQYFGRQTIGVTGTKGKSTTSSLIAHILKENGKDVVLLGNIGIPAFDKLSEISENTIVVFELSAHQLEYVHHSPKAAVLLNIFPEHLDHFKNFDAYRLAKLNVTKYQHKDDLLVTTKALAEDILTSKATTLFFEEGNNINPDTIQLKGIHNLNNVKAAVLAARFFGVKEQNAVKSAGSFKPLPHRMEYVGYYGNIHFYNDSISTIPQSAIAAIEAIGNIDTLILGGFDRGLDYLSLLEFVERSTIKNIIFTGMAGKKMFALFSGMNHHGKLTFLVDGLVEAFEIIKKHTPENGICLLSPAAASYDQYHNFEHRGDVFKALAKDLQ